MAFKNSMPSSVRAQIEWIESKEWYDTAYNLMRECYRASAGGPLNAEKLLNSMWEYFQHVGPYLPNRKVAIEIREELKNLKKKSKLIQQYSSSKAIMLKNKELHQMHEKLQDIKWEMSLEEQRANLFLRIHRHDPSRAAREF